MANVGRSVICVGTGNNGNDRIHTAGKLRQGQIEMIEMSIGTYETTLNLQLWKTYADEISELDAKMLKLRDKIEKM